MEVNCPFKHKQLVNDDSRIQWKSADDTNVKIGHKSIDIPFVDGKAIKNFDELPKKEIYVCDVTNKECIGENMCPIFNSY